MCGIAACVGNTQCALIVKSLLMQLQHRGQEGAGIAWLQDGKISVFKNVGYVSQALPDINVKTKIAIGHVRYSTTGTYTKNLEELHPIVVRDSSIEIAVAFNGTIFNYKQIRKELEQYYTFVTDTDTEVIAKLVHREYKQCRDVVETIQHVAEKLRGSYAMTILVGNKLVLVRDPHGFKPLSYYMSDGLFVAASESCAITTLFDVDPDDVREVQPGEIVIVSEDLEIERYLIDTSRSVRRAYCAFEYVYFARPDTIFNGVYVYDARKRMGKYLAEYENQEIDVVVPIPETGRVAAYGYSQALNKPVEEALIKLRYLGRSFIMPKEVRASIAKFGIIKSVIKSKSIALVDDSLVRGTTLRNLVRLLRSVGARKVHVRIASPPIRYPCFMGIDFPTRQELIAHGRTVEEVCKLIEADSLIYLPVEDLVRAISIPEDQLCLACFTGNYPIPLDVEEQERYMKRQE